LSKANNEALTTFGFDLNQPDAAATATAEMADLPATANG
jgi:hypothetical protein